MKKVGITALLITALVLPVILFWLLRSRSHLNGVAAAGIAVATGWALNVAWAFASQGSITNAPSPANGDTLSIAHALWLGLPYNPGVDHLACLALQDAARSINPPAPPEKQTHKSGRPVHTP
jgi:hypothetical protein